jgi:hypothetical protein
MSEVDDKIKQFESLCRLVLQSIFNLSHADCRTRVDFKDLYEVLSQEGYDDREQVNACINYLGSARYIDNEIKSTSDNACTIYLSTAITAFGIKFLKLGIIEAFNEPGSNSIYNFQNIKDANFIIGDNNKQEIHSETAELEKFLKLTEDLISKLPDETTLIDIKKAILDQKEEGRPSKVLIRMLRNQLMALAIKAGIEVSKYGITNLF